MAMRGILVDTNAYVAFTQGQREAVEVIRRATPVALNSIILGELLAGFAFGSHEAKNRAELQEFFKSSRVVMLTADQDTARYYAIVYSNLRNKGRPIPTNDMWIAASALQHNIALFSYDQHFKNVDGVTVGTTPSDLMLP